MKILKSLLAVGLVALSSSIVLAQDVSETTAFAGTVVAVSDNSITVKTDAGDKVLAIDSATQFIDVTKASEIKVGQVVGIRCDLGEKKAFLIRGKWPPQ